MFNLVQQSAAWLLALSVTFAGEVVHAQNQSAKAAPFAELVEVIREVRLPEPRPELDAEELYKRSQGSRAALAFLFTRLELQRVPSSGPLPPQVLSEVQAAVILDALALAPPQTVIRIRNRRMEEFESKQPALKNEFTKEQRRVQSAALQVTGAVGLGEAVDDLFRITQWPTKAELPRATEIVFEEALLRLLVLHPSNHERLIYQWDRNQPAIAVAALRAVGRAGSPLGLGFIEDVLRWSPELTSAAAAQVRILGPACDPDQNESLINLLINRFQHVDATIGAEICLALGGLRNEAALEDLIDLLAFESPFNSGFTTSKPELRVRESALWALCEISGKSFPNNQHIWRIWMADETTWLNEQASHWLPRLRSNEPAVAAEALSQVAKRRIGRDRLARAIAPLLETGTPHIQELACQALTDLDSPIIAVQLLDAAEGPGGQLQDDAWKTLCHITRTSPESPKHLLASQIRLSR